jgi:TRAP-type C4-dicarboxylate transport system permease small subunit
MVVAILIQIFFRYVLGNALPWPDEAARFLMLWMTGLIAPLGLRRGGFVAIDMIPRMLPEMVGRLVNLLLFGIAMIVLVWAVQIGWAEVTGFSGKFKTSSLYYPSGDGWQKMPRAWMMGSLFVGMVLMILVQVELILREVVGLLGGAARLDPIDGEAVEAS